MLRRVARKYSAVDSAFAAGSVVRSVPTLLVTTVTTFFVLTPRSIRPRRVTSIVPPP